jgi:predicted peroxiredoxin/TusA-related sulfurtransferase
MEASTMAGTSMKESIDVRGKQITTFILHVAVTKLRDMEKGEALEIVTDNFEAIESDIRSWCRMTGHNLMGVQKQADEERYVIEKGEPTAEDHGLALVVSDPALEQLISPLGFALGAALAGNGVSIYFQGPGVRVLKRGFKERLQGVSRLFSRFARDGLARIGHIPPQEKLRQLRELGARLYVCGPSMERFGVKKSDLIFDDVTVCEYLTFIEQMNRADVHIFLQ